MILPEHSVLSNVHLVCCFFVCLFLTFKSHILHAVKYTVNHLVSFDKQGRGHFH